MLEKKDVGRLGIIFVFTAVAVLLILWRYISLMLLTPEDSRPPEGTTSVDRGPILDRNGRVLAIQTSLRSVTAWIPNIVDKERTAELLGPILDRTGDAIKSILNSRTGFAYLQRKIPQSAADRIEALIVKGELPGIDLVRESARTYPEQRTAAHLIGIVDIDNNGLEGLERVYDDQLSPEPESGNGREVYGNQVFLTIDLNMQYIAESLAERTVEEQEAESVMILAMDARNGEFLAYATTPGFNPNTYTDFPAENRINRPATNAYEPGSVFKIFSIASFLEIGGINQLSSFICPGYYEHPDIPDRIACLGVHGEVTPGLIIKYSCNAGAAYASETVGRDSFYERIRAFGFGEATGLPIPGESNGLLESPVDWSARTKPTMAFGQEISTSAVQIVSAATVFANEGMRLEPSIVRKIVSPEGKTLTSHTRTPVEQVISGNTARQMLLMMEEATEESGTATRARVDGIRVSAKTGTAQVFNPETGSYSEDQFVASCLAIFPTDDPQVIVYVVIKNPQAGETFGGRIAAPVVGEMADELVSYLGIPRENDTVLGHSGVVEIRKLPPVNIGDTMPDLSGYSKRQLLPLLERNDIEVMIRGEGWVVGQSPAAGTVLPDGAKIILELE